MRLGRYVAVAVCVVALSGGAFADGGAGGKPDTTVTPEVSKPSQGKPASVQRTTKKTNWSKIKTLFE